MAIKIYEKFAPRANPANGDYPYGSIKNESVPGAKDGTPLDAAWGNDMGGFTDALLTDAGITPSGAADTAIASQRLDALKKVSSLQSAILLIEQWGYTYKGTFAKGFTYSQVGDAGVDADSNVWIYVGAGAPNKVVAAGTVPSVGAGYEQVTFNAAGGVVFTDGSNVQDFKYTNGQIFDAPNSVPNSYPTGAVCIIYGGRYTVVGAGDSGGFYLPMLGTTNKLKLTYESTLDLSHIGCIMDGVTDNTALIESFLSTIEPDSTLHITIPNNTKYDFQTIVNLLPVRSNVTDNSSVSAWDSSGFRQKTIGVYERGDITSVADLNRVLSSGHNAADILENTGESGSVSGDKRVVSWSWSTGRFKDGSPGIRLLSRNEYAESNVRTGVWAYTIRKRAPWSARDYEIWRPDKSFSVGDVCLADTTKRYYKAATSGVSGSTQPSHTSGVVSDGGVSWEILDRYSFDATVFYMDELGRVATNTGAATGFTQRWKQAIQDVENMTCQWEGTGPSKGVIHKLAPTNASGAVVPIPFLQGSESGGLRVFNSTTTEEFARFTDARGFELGAYGHREVVAVAGDTTPSVKGIGVIVFSNTSSTYVTNFIDGKPTQEITVISTSNNTTLVHSALIHLKGGVDAAIPQFGVLTLIKWSGTTRWIEKSRSF